MIGRRALDDLTDRERTHEALRESEARLRSVLEGSRDVVYRFDLQTQRYDYVSPSVEELLGYTAAELCAQDLETAMATVHPDDVSALRAAYADSERTGTAEAVYRQRTRSGEYRWVSDRMSVRTEARGRALFRVGNVRDVTEARRAEEALRETNARLEAGQEERSTQLNAERRRLFEVLETLPAMICLLTPDRHVRFANRAFREKFGEADGRHCYEQCFGKSAPCEFCESFKVLETGEPHCWEVSTPDASIVAAHDYPFTDADGSRLVLEMDLDVTAQRRNEAALKQLQENLEARVVERTRRLQQSEEALRESEERYRLLFENLSSAHRDIQSVIDNTPAIVYAFDLEERFVLANSACAGLLDSTPERLIGRRRHEFMPREDADWHEGNDRQAIEAGKALTFEEYSELGGRSITWLTTKFPLRDGQGRICAVAGISSDISERKRAEAERERLIAALRDADRRKNDFLAVLSHELRNPLAPIANSLYILDHARPGGEQADRAKQVIQRQVAQLTSLVNDLLDVTRITRNKVQLQKEPLELNDLVRRAVEDNRSFLEHAGVRLELALAPRPVPVLADRTRVSQIVGNLLQNAAKFSTPGGSTRVSVATEGHAAVIRVTDDGVGIDEATLRDLFQPFMQADKTLDRSKGGLGLGLALVKGLVELHGGSVSARSDGPGKGSEFVVRLPLDDGAAPEPRAAAGGPAQARRRILVIEDNLDAAESLREVLELGGHRVEVAHDGQSGIDKARAFRPEVVLCDIGLPGMDGYAVARAFRADEVLKRAFLIALSGYALPEDLQRAVEAGFARHVSKPPSVERLHEALSAAPDPGRQTA